MGTSDMLHSIYSYCKVYPFITMMAGIIVVFGLYVGARPTVEFFLNTLEGCFKIFKALLSGNLEKERTSVLFLGLIVAVVITFYMFGPYMWIFFTMSYIYENRGAKILLLIFSALIATFFVARTVYRQEENTV